MSAAPETKVDEVKPIEATSASATTPAAATTETPIPETTTTSADAPVTTASDAKPDDTKPLPAAPVADKTTETAAASDKVEPVSSGVLGYKAPKLLKQFIFSKRQVWLGEEPVSSQNLNHYLRSTEAKVAHPVAAWSAQTGKGILYLVKTEADKKNPHDALLLADAVELTKDSSHEFSFKIHGDKHAFKAKDDAERNGWFVAVESAITEAKASKESILSSESYKESISHLGKPAALAGGVAAGTGAAGTGAAAAHHKHEENKSVTAPATTDATTTTTATEPAEEPAVVATPTKDDTKKRTGSRSASRGKRTSIFGALKNKKDEAEHKSEAKKEAKKEEKAAEKDKPVEALTTTEVAAAGVGGASGGIAAAALSDTSKSPEHSHTTAETAPATATDATPAEVTKDEETVTPKPAKRNSIFGSFYQKVRSPTTEKKESETIPSTSAKDETATSATPAAATTTADETSVAPVNGIADVKSEESALPAALPAAAEPTTGTTSTGDKTEAAKIEEKKEKAVSPKKEKESFLGGLFGGLANRTRSPSSKREAKDAEKVEKTAEGPAVPPKDETAIDTVTKTEDPALAPSAVAAPAASAPTATSSATPATTIDEAFGATSGTNEEVSAAPASTTTAPQEASTTTGTDTVKSTSPKESRRRSIFGGFGSKKEGESEGEKSGGLAAIFRRPSQAIRSATEKREAKKENAVPTESTIAEKPSTATETTPQPTTAAEETIVKPDQKSVESEKPSGAIGDVVPEAVNVGQPQQTANTTVSATA